MNKWENVYIFISSTFNDMHAERDYLVKKVFPELAIWCEERCLRLVDIDLRWGITKKDADENKRVVELCLKNIDKCRPFFLCFLGQRRGWVPKKEDINVNTLEEMKDLNGYVGDYSITELEIEHALFHPFSNNKKVDRALFFFRDDSYLNEMTGDTPQRKVYINSNENDTSKLNEYKKKIASTNNIFNYKVKWKKNLFTNELSNELNEGRITDFKIGDIELKNIIIDELKKQITNTFPNHIPCNDKEDEFLFLNSDNIIGRNSDIDKLNNYIEKNNIIPISSETGMGKTNFLIDFCNNSNKIIIKCFARNNDIYDTYHLKESILKELKEKKYIESYNVNMFNLDIDIDENIIYLIDGVDELKDDDISFIPLSLKRAKFIFSYSSDTKTGDKITKLLNKSNINIYNLNGINELSDKRVIVNEYLSQYLKNIDEDEINELINLKGSYNPLYLKIILSELRVYGSFDTLMKKIKNDYGNTPAKAFNSILIRLENDGVEYGISDKSFIKYLFLSLAVSRTGLNINELSNIIKRITNLSESYIIDTIYYYFRQLKELIILKNGLYDFKYNVFKIVTIERYEKDYTLINKIIAELFITNLGANYENENERYFKELSYHLKEAKMNKYLEDMLCNYFYIYHKNNCLDINNLLLDYELVDTTKTNLIKEKLSLSRFHILKDKKILDSLLYCHLMDSKMPILKDIKNNYKSYLITMDENYYDKLSKYQYDLFYPPKAGVKQILFSNDIMVVLGHIADMYIYDINSKKIRKKIEMVISFDKKIEIENNMIILSSTDDKIYYDLCDGNYVKNESTNKTLIMSKNTSITSLLDRPTSYVYDKLNINLDNFVVNINNKIYIKHGQIHNIYIYKKYLITESIEEIRLWDLDLINNDIDSIKDSGRIKNMYVSDCDNAIIYLFLNGRGVLKLNNDSKTSYIFETNGEEVKSIEYDGYFIWIIYKEYIEKIEINKCKKEYLNKINSYEALYNIKCYNDYTIFDVDIDKKPKIICYDKLNNNFIDILMLNETIKLSDIALPVKYKDKYIYTHGEQIYVFDDEKKYTNKYEYFNEPCCYINKNLIIYDDKLYTVNNNKGCINIYDLNIKYIGSFGHIFSNEYRCAAIINIIIKNNNAYISYTNNYLYVYDLNNYVCIATYYGENGISKFYVGNENKIIILNNINEIENITINYK